MKCPHCDQELQTVGRFQICPEHGPVAGVGEADHFKQLADAFAGDAAGQAEQSRIKRQRFLRR